VAVVEACLPYLTERFGNMLAVLRNWTHRHLFAAQVIALTTRFIAN
jgi:hypothetical protein